MILLTLLLVVLPFRAPDGWQAHALSQAHPQTQPEAVRIGLLVSPDALGSGMSRGAELAVAEANRSGGFDGRPFELVSRSVEGPWGSGSKQIVGLVTEDDVWAVLGGLDGRTAHLAEQVVAKLQVPLVSPWASDPTLTQAFVPWFFRVVPDDRDQASAMVREIFAERRLTGAVSLVVDSYDARTAAGAFARAVEAAGHAAPLEVSLPGAATSLDSVVRAVPGGAADGIVIFGPYSHLERLIRTLGQTDSDGPVFAPLPVADELLSLGSRSGTTESTRLPVAVVAPGHWTTPEGTAFSDSFERTYGEPPPAVAAYAYDGANVIIEAIREAGLDRSGIRDAMASIDIPDGVTGPIRFDANGNRESRIELSTVFLSDTGRRQ